MNIEGVLVPVVTPFDEQNNVDYSALGKLLDHLIEAGVRGIVACGTTGEYYTFNDEERHGVMSFIADHVGDRALLIAGVNDTYTAGSIQKAKQAKAMGYQGLMLAPPIYCLPQENEIICHFKTVSREADMPIIMYNFPARSGVEISVEAVIELSHDKNIIGIKESSGDFSRALSLINAGLSNFEVVCGSDDQAADYLFWGVRSWIGGAANYLAESHVQLIDAAKQGDFSTLRTIMQRILPVIKDQESADYNQKAKLGCAQIGIPVGTVRAPLLPICDKDKAIFLGKLNQAIQ
ncbi:4-hydroxy-tetrahydrodipicolinate synthase [Aestuariirhabdus sp. Z084]|uniref:4-hydroxy-tetrahydrodipicolinate synthase n=1 Tax=Aestuariirhabdus haliotis TaxID=2918751 RepID=UPI00201B3C09|nr:4-hydroxy-tetrahydrodipicolinate synthase [Aestuariirhabdus haliotis]MCL6416830.1 4-hydroxy-tetrahydrodipicolinate synthase [Aestuariirhabdus haliotis]MCL6420830.1 4-hydroxy-tetrahydrodipicolinate synthase [Aestuariirhabdus haliotis]